MSELESLVRQWLAEVDEADEEFVTGHDLIVRIGARWEYGKYSEKFKEILNIESDEVPNA